MSKLKAIFTRFKAPMAAAMAFPLMTVMAFASSDPTSFDLTTIMSDAATKIVGDLLKMVASVLPITVTLLGMSIGIAYGIKFIKSITKKAG